MGHKQSREGRAGTAEADAARRRPDSRDQAAQPERGPDRAGKEADAWSRETGYRPSANQMRDEPMPASHHASHDQDAVVRNAQHATGNGKARPSRGARTRPPR